MGHDSEITINQSSAVSQDPTFKATMERGFWVGGERWGEEFDGTVYPLRQIQKHHPVSSEQPAVLVEGDSIALGPDLFTDSL